VEGGCTLKIYTSGISGLRLRNTHQLAMTGGVEASELTAATVNLHALHSPAEAVTNNPLRAGIYALSA